MAGCSKPGPVQAPINSQKATPEAGQGSPKGIDACSLITTKEIEAIQGTPLKDTKGSSNAQGGLTVSQCYFLLPMIADSIVVSVTQKGSGSNGRNPKESWDEMFHREKGKTNAREEEEKEVAAPQEITGLGDEAFWVTRRYGGKLYVLKRGTYISIGVGSPGDQAAKMQKAKALAEIVLKRL